MKGCYTRDCHTEKNIKTYPYDPLFIKKDVTQYGMQLLDSFEVFATFSNPWYLFGRTKFF